MDKNSLLLIFTALPAIVYLGIKIEILRQKRKYREDESSIVEKYQSNIFSLEEKREKKKESTDSQEYDKAA